jgi:hypothetical protein
LIAGASTEYGTEAIIFEYRVFDVGNGDDDNWLAAGTEGPTTTSKYIVGVSAGVSYEASVTYRVAGVLSPRLILAAATSAGVSLDVQLIATSFPRNLTLAITSAGVVTVSNHDRVYNDKVVAVTGGTVTPSPAGTNPDKIGVFYDDAARAGGAVTYQYQKFAGGTGEIDGLFPSVDNPARHFICLMVVPASGSTGGGSGTGSGGGAGGPPGGGGLNEF